MTILLLAVGVVVAALLAGLVYSTRKHKFASTGTAEHLEDFTFSCNHLANLGQVRQALDPADLEFVKNRLHPRAARRLHRERQRVACRYLESLYGDFSRIMRATQLVAALSPEVKAHQEWERFRLNLEFQLKYRLLKAKFALGSTQFPSLNNLARIVSSLAMDLERVVKMS